MEPALISGGAGLLGAILGAGTAFAGKWIDARHSRETERRRQVDDLLAKFWEATDRLWHISKELRSTVIMIRGSTEAGRPIDDEVYAQRVRGFEAEQQAATEAGYLLARMRLLQLDFALVGTARRLLDASRFSSVINPSTPANHREDALSRFESDVTRFVE